MSRWPYNSAAWTHRRRQVLGESASRSATGRAVCVDCGGVATAVDHIVPLSEGGAPFDLNNLRPIAVPVTAGAWRSDVRSSPSDRLTGRGGVRPQRRIW